LAKAIDSKSQAPTTQQIRDEIKEDEDENNERYAAIIIRGVVSDESESANDLTNHRLDSSYFHPPH
jgi:hypothetical protein